MNEHPVKQEIDAIDVWVQADESCTFKVGEKGVTRIEACEKSGMYSTIPYVRVWNGRLCVAEFCQHNIIGVFFSEQPREEFRL